MRSTALFVLLSVNLVLGGCHAGSMDNASQQASAASAAATAGGPLLTSPASPDTPAPGGEPQAASHGSPGAAPAPLTADAAKTEKGARAELLAWARAIELRHFAQAWAMMGDTAKAQLGRAEFEARFAPMKDIVVEVPGGTMEGAAGSSYYTVPTTIRGVRSDRSTMVLAGEVVLRRVNDVPGASAAQLAWHIERVDLARR